MVKYESKIKKSTSNDVDIYKFISNFNNFEQVIPKDKIQNWQSTEDSCRFSVQGVGEAGLKIIDKEPNKTVKFTSDGKVPFNFFLWVQLKQVAPEDTRIKLTIKADINPMMKMVVSKHIDKFLDVLSEAISSYNYSK